MKKRTNRWFAGFAPVLLSAVLLTGCAVTALEGVQEGVAPASAPRQTGEPNGEPDLIPPADEIRQDYGKLSVRMAGEVKAGAETIGFRIDNAGDTDYGYGYADLLLLKKTEDGWKTYCRLGAVPEIGILVPAGGSSAESIVVGQYGVQLKAGETYRVALARHWGETGELTAYAEFTVGEAS